MDATGRCTLNFTLPGTPSPSADAPFPSWEAAALALLQRAAWTPPAGPLPPLVDASRQPTPTVAMLLVAIRLHCVLWEELGFRWGQLQPARGVWRTKKHQGGRRASGEGHNPNRRLRMVVKLPGGVTLKQETFRGQDAVVKVGWALLQRVHGRIGTVH